MKIERGFLIELEDILEFHFEGLEAISAKFELLCLIGCMNMIEFIGGIYNGKLGIGGKEALRFKEGVRFLGGIYSDSRILGEKRMWELRCAVTHQYIPEICDIEVIKVGKVYCVGQTNKKSKEVLANIKDKNRFLLEIKLDKLVSDLKEASLRLIKQLKEDKGMRDIADKQFNKLPWIVTPKRLEWIEKELEKDFKEEYGLM